MKYTNNQKSSASRGSVLVVALVICMIGTLGVIATVSIIQGRAGQSEAELSGVDRRVKFNNSKSLAKEAMYRNYLHDDSPLGTAASFDIGDWGSVTIGTFDTAALAFNDAARTHPTGAAPLRAFSQDVAVQIGDGVTTHGMEYQMRSYNPALAGDLLSIHPASETASEQVRVTGDLRVKGRAIFWPGDYYTDAPSTVRAEEVVVPASNGPNLVMEDPDDNAILPSNYIPYAQTSGIVPSGNNYGGEINILNNVSSPNAYFQRLTALGGETSLLGTLGVTDALGPATVLANPIDAILITAIQDLGLAESALVGLLAANVPLSSNVMFELLNRAVPVSDAYLIPLMNSQTPLPDDVMIALGNPSFGVSPATREALLNNTGYSYISDGAGTLTVNLNSIYLPNLLVQNVSQVILKGQDNATEASAAADLQPRVVAIQNADNVLLSMVTLKGVTNQRRMVLALSQTGVLDNADLTDAAGNLLPPGSNMTLFEFDSPDPFVDWRMITEMQGVSSFWDVDGVSTATLIGGIRTDHSVRINGGTLNLELEEEVEDLESMVSRNAWLEVYK